MWNNKYFLDKFEVFFYRGNKFSITLKMSQRKGRLGRSGRLILSARITSSAGLTVISTERLRQAFISVDSQQRQQKAAEQKRVNKL